jgi:hypothetical protein
MREDSVFDLVRERVDVDDNVIALPDLMHGRLADLIQAAGGPAQDHELRGESAARSAFRSAAQSWPSRRWSRMRGGPAVVAATTVATMLVATTGLAAASVLPGSAGRAVDGFLGNMGVHITSPSTPAAPPAPDVTGTSAVSAPALHPAGTVHIGCTIGGTTSSGAVAGTVESSSCALTAPLPPRSHGTTTSSPATVIRSTPVTKAAPVVHQAGSGSGSHSGQPPTPTTTPTTLPGGGTSRGGNQGVGGGTCKGGPTGTTTTTTTTDPTTTTTAGPSAAAGGCGHRGHSHGGSGSTTSPSTGGTGTTSS